MADERVICCCGASSWTKVIAWFQIVMNVIIMVISIVGVVSLAAIDVDNDQAANKNTAIAALAITFIMSLLGLVMGVILLKGTNDRNVGYIRVWIIYAVIAVIVSVVSLILNTTGSITSTTIGTAVFSGILGFAINVFCIVVVFIHMKEIKEGVFM